MKCEKSLVMYYRCKTNDVCVPCAYLLHSANRVRALKSGVVIFTPTPSQIAEGLEFDLQWPAGFVYIVTSCFFWGAWLATLTLLASLLQV